MEKHARIYEDKDYEGEFNLFRAEKTAIMKALIYQDRLKEVANVLDIDHDSLRHKMKSHSLHKKDFGFN